MSQPPIRIPESVLAVARKTLFKEKIREDSSISLATPHTRPQPTTSGAFQSPHSPHPSQPPILSRTNSGPSASSTSPNPSLHDACSSPRSKEGLIACPKPNSLFPFYTATPAPQTAPTPSPDAIGGPGVHSSSPSSSPATCLAPCFDPRPVQSAAPRLVPGTGRLIQTSLQFPSSAKNAPLPHTTPNPSAHSSHKSPSTYGTEASRSIARSAQVTKPKAAKVKNRTLNGSRQRGWADGLRSDILARSVPAYAEAWKKGRDEENDQWDAICNDFNSRVPWDYSDDEELPVDTNVSGPVDPPHVDHLTAEEKEERRKILESRNAAIRRWLKTRAEDYNRRNSTRVETGQLADGTITTKTTVTKSVIDSILQPKLKVPKLLTPVQVFWKMELALVSKTTTDALTKLRPEALLAGRELPKNDISLQYSIAAQLFTTTLGGSKARERTSNECCNENLVQAIGPILQNAAKQAGYNFVAFFYGPMVKKSGDHGVEALQYGRTEHTNETFTQHCDNDLWDQFQEALLNHSSDTFIDVEEFGDTDSPIEDLTSLPEDSLCPPGHDAAPLQQNTLDSQLLNEEFLRNHDTAPVTEDSSTNVLEDRTSPSQVDKIPLPLDDMIPLPDNFLKNGDIFSPGDDHSHPPCDDMPPRERDMSPQVGCDTSSPENVTAPTTSKDLSSSPADNTIMDTSDDSRSPTLNITTTSHSSDGNPPEDNTLNAHNGTDTSSLKRQLDDTQPLPESSLDSSNDIASHKRPRLASHSSQDFAPTTATATDTDAFMAIDTSSHDHPIDAPTASIGTPSNNLPSDAPAQIPGTSISMESLITMDNPPQNLHSSDITMSDVSTERESSAVPIPETRRLDKTSGFSGHGTHGTDKLLSKSCPEVERKETKWFTEAWTLVTPEGLEEPEYWACLTGWHQLESCNVFQDNVKGFLTNRLCPEEIRVWIKKKGAPDFTKWDGEDFGKRLCAWWNANQPDSRKALGIWVTVPLDDEKPIDDLLEAPDKKWLHFQVPGRNGFCLMLIGLSWWWHSARKSNKDLALWKHLVNDVRFMMALVERILLGF
ncbi:hypothetical protein DL96DRAFT_1716165 [Flagelloscypha sp. PMI_526]|nr:hypothetical protein DL96DRAFT_1716165 [Flagelloscypha sp. PMI_526]